MFLLREIALFLDPFNSRSPHFWKVQLYATTDICYKIPLVLQHCKGTLQICFMVRQSLNKKEGNSERIEHYSETFA